MSEARLLLLGVTSLIVARCANQRVPDQGFLQPPATDARRTISSPPAYWPTGAWLVSTPEEQGVRSASLADVLDAATTARLPIHELVVIRHGVLVLDATFAPFTPGTRHDVASVTKSVTSLMLGSAVQSGLVNADMLLRDALPNAAPLQQDARRGAIRLVDLVGMQSGIDCGFKSGEAELRAMKNTKHWMEYILALPMRTTPGETVGYCSPNYHLLSGAISQLTAGSLAQYAQEKLFNPLGVHDVYWPSDPQGVTHGWGDLQLRPLDLAKIGLLVLHGGEWDGRQIVPRQWIQWSTTQHVRHSGTNFYGYGWWTHSDAPAGFYEALGRGGQRLSIWPAKDLIVVMVGGGFEPSILAPFILQAVTSDTALSPDTIARSRLENRVYAARTPASTPLHHRAPACAADIDGRRYAVAASAMGLHSFTLGFPAGDSSTGTVRLEFADRIVNLALGLDGAYRKANEQIDEIAPMGRGEWRAPCEFTVEMDLVGKIDHYTLTIAFSGMQAHLNIQERSGLFHERTTAMAGR